MNNHSMAVAASEMHVNHKYVDEIQNLEYHGNLWNANNVLVHMPSTGLITLFLRCKDICLVLFCPYFQAASK